MKKMKLLKYRFMFILFIFCIFSPVFAHGAGVNISLNTPKEKILPGESVSVTPVFEVSSKLNVSAFMIIINFDSSKLDLKSVFPMESILPSEIKAKQEGGGVTVIFLSKGSGIDILPGKEFSFFKIEFKARNEIGDTEISANLDGLGNCSAEPLFSFPINPVEISICEPMQNDCTLRSLEVRGAFMDPEFAPAIFNYSVDALYNKKYIDFSTEASGLEDFFEVNEYSIKLIAEATNPKASVKINRKTLEKAGEPTDVVITVTSEDKTEKVRYRVRVNRAGMIFVDAQDIDKTQKNLTGNQKSGNLVKERSEKKNAPVSSEKLEKFKDEDKLEKSNARKSKSFTPVASDTAGNLDTNFEAEDGCTEDVAGKNPKIIVREGSFHVPLFCSTAILILVVLFFVYFGVKSNSNNKRKGADMDNNETNV
jgi:hypothetical protein